MNIGMEMQFKEGLIFSLYTGEPNDFPKWTPTYSTKMDMELMSKDLAACELTCIT